jgi:hypothetical protein
MYRIYTIGSMLTLQEKKDINSKKKIKKLIKRFFQKKVEFSQELKSIRIGNQNY